MKAKIQRAGSGDRVADARSGGFTLVELLVAITIFLFVVMGVVFAHLYGLSMFRITETTLNATDDARRAAGKMTDEIRTCQRLSIGNVNNGTFTGLLNGEKQEGSALTIRPTTNDLPYVMYFVNPSDKTFRRTTSTPGSTVIVAESITNSMVFRAENYLGTVQSNNSPRVIHFKLEFYKPKRRTQVADYYKLETSVAVRN